MDVAVGGGMPSWGCTIRVKSVKSPPFLNGWGLFEVSQFGAPTPPASMGIFFLLLSKSKIKEVNNGTRHMVVEFSPGAKYHFLKTRPVSEATENTKMPWRV